MKAGQVITVHNSSDDDFGVAGAHIESKVIDEHYHYNHNFAWRLLSAFVYYIIAPLPVFLLGVGHGLRFANRSALRGGRGCYLYFNHTHWLDAVIPYLLCFPRRAWVVIGPTAVSVPALRQLVALVGGVPLNTTAAGKVAFRAFLAKQVARGGCVAIYPEAHEWPYFNGVRHFSPYAFTYPVRTATDVFGAVVTYRRRPILSLRAPHMTVTLSQPMPPSAWTDSDDPKALLRDGVYQFMDETIKAKRSYAWVSYVDEQGQPV